MQKELRAKEQFDKKTKVPEHKEGDEVWLFCSKTPVGLTPKLYRKWVGPYYITKAYENFTYKLRRCTDDKEMKSLIHANRLKPFHDPELRPTNPPPDLSEAELDPEELDDEVANPLSNQPKPESAPPEQQNGPEPTIREEPQVNNDPDHNVDSKDKDSSPSQKQSLSQEWQLVEQILKCKPYNGIKHYLVKWQEDGTTQWLPQQHVSPALRREFHINRTLEGKKRRRPMESTNLKLNLD